MGMTALALTLHALSRVLSPSCWLHAISSPSDIEQAIFFYSALPRVAVALIAGAALGLSGTLFQWVLRNPLAEPTTLGVSTGAQLALTAATLFAPNLLNFGREEIALIGAALSTIFVFAIAYRQGFASLSLILGGLIVNLFAGACGAILILFHGDYLQGIFVWNTGSLIQNDWSEVFYLLPRLLVAGLIAALLAGPLSMLALDDESARSLGVPMRTLRILALVIAVALAAFVVSAVGVISFVALASPALARLAGARQLRFQLIAASLTGACLLWLTDQLVLALSAVVPDLATGAAAALLGAPLLIVMLTHLPAPALPRRGDHAAAVARSRHPYWLAAGCFAALIIVVFIALDLGKGPHGWYLADVGELQRLLQWRWPHTVAALTAGAMLAAAGTMLQRLTGNDMASPESLGISPGALIGVVVVVMLLPFADKSAQIAAGTGGAFVTLMILLILAGRSRVSPERTLLTGVALGSAFSAVVILILASGLPRVSMLLSWMAGSTSRVTAADAITTVDVVIVLSALIPLTARWLEILPLGETTSRAIGLDLSRSRFAILVMTSVLTAAATLIVGPLSFVGLIGPHMARMVGLQRPLPQLFGAAAGGGLLMLTADWLGHNLMFPYQIPAGLLATFLGASFFLVLLWRGAK